MARRHFGLKLPLGYWMGFNHCNSDTWFDCALLRVANQCLNDTWYTYGESICGIGDTRGGEQGREREGSVRTGTPRGQETTLPTVASFGGATQPTNCEAMNGACNRASPLPQSKQASKEERDRAANGVVCRGEEPRSTVRSG